MGTRSSVAKAPTLAAFLSCVQRRIVLRMQIADDDIREFQDIWRQEFGDELDDDQARDQISRLDVLYRVLFSPQQQ